jgi:hypothetical protein
MTDAAKVAADTTYAATTDWYATAAALKGTSNFSTNILAAGATTLAASLDNAAPTNARYVQLRADLNDGTVSRQFLLGVSLARPTAPW